MASVFSFFGGRGAFSTMGVMAVYCRSRTVPSFRSYGEERLRVMSTPHDKDPQLTRVLLFDCLMGCPLLCCRLLGLPC